MIKRTTALLLGVAMVAAAPGMFSAGLTGAAFAAEPISAAVRGDGWYHFGPGGTVTHREDIVADGVTLATLSNGVRLVLKPTNLVEDEVLVNVMVDGGYQSLAPGDRAAADIAASMFVQAGVGLKTYDELVATFGQVATSIEFDLWHEQFNFGAEAQSTELRPLLEILTAYVSDPGWRFEGLEATKAQAVEALSVVASSPSLAFKIHAPGLLASGDPRYVQPSAAQYGDVDGDEARRAIEGQIKSGAIEIAIVGDFELESTISMAAETFGTFPVRTEAASNQSAPMFPAHKTTPMQIILDSRARDQGRMIAWPAPLGLFKSREETVIQAMLGVIIFRLREDPEYEIDGCCGLHVNHESGFVGLSAVGHPDVPEAFGFDIENIARDIVTNGVTQEELDRARAPFVRDIERAREMQKNMYWIVTAQNIRGDRNDWENAVSLLPFMESVTPEDVQRAAARYLVEERAVQIVAVPEPAPVE